MRYDGSSDVSSAFTGTLLTISQGDVAISNVTLDGNKNKVNTGGSLLYISGSTTTVTLGADTTLRNNKTTIYGGAVCISEGTFEMAGGTITGNFASFGGGVFVDNGGTFKMSEGEISGNNANFGGGVYASNSNFTMTGGKIISNTASYGGGLSLSNVIFNMSDGEITGNTARTDKNGIDAKNSTTINKTGGIVQDD